MIFLASLGTILLINASLQPVPPPEDFTIFIPNSSVPL